MEDLYERNHKMYEARENGETYNSIARKFHRSYATVQRSCYIVEKEMRMKGIPRDKFKEECLGQVYHMSTRTWALLKRANINSMDELMKLSNEDLLKIPGVGIVTMNEIRDVINNEKIKRAILNGKSDDEIKQKLDVSDYQIASIHAYVNESMCFDDHDSALYNLAIEKSGSRRMGTRVYRALTGAGVSTIDKLKKLDPESLLSKRDVGRKTYEIVKEMIVEIGG